jgi:hypothetical protein
VVSHIIHLLLTDHPVLPLLVASINNFSLVVQVFKVISGEDKRIGKGMNVNIRLPVVGGCFQVGFVDGLAS